MRTKEITIAAGGAADDDAFAASQALTADTPLTLEASAAAITPPRELTLTSADDLSAVTFAIVGVDRYGQRITESIIGPNADTVSSKLIYSAIESITPDATSADEVSAGYPQRVCSRWILLDTTRATDAVPTGLVQALAVAGETFAAASVERTMQNFMRIGGDGAEPAGTPGSLAAAGDVVQVQGAALRIVVTGASGQSKFAVTRPGF